MPLVKRKQPKCRVGQFRIPVTLVRRDTASLGDYGEANKTEQATQFLAYVETLSGRELETARQLVGNATHRVVMRYAAGVSVKDAFSVAGLGTLEIGHVNNVEQRNLELDMICVGKAE